VYVCNPAVCRRHVLPATLLVHCMVFLFIAYIRANDCYSTMDVKSIIQQWYKELAEDAEEFEQQAQRVSVWDQQLRENQKVRKIVAYCMCQFGIYLVLVW
jgi:hypothetical protein